MFLLAIFDSSMAASYCSFVSSSKVGLGFLSPALAFALAGAFSLGCGSLVFVTIAKSSFLASFTKAKACRAVAGNGDCVSHKIPI